MSDIRALLRRTAELASDFLESLDDRPVFPQTSVDELRKALGGALPEEPTAPEAVVEGLVAAPAPRPRTLVLYKDIEERSFSCKVNDHNGLLARLREVKEPDELKLMRKSIGYTAAGHARILETLKPGMREFELKDAIEDAFRKAGSRHRQSPWRSWRRSHPRRFRRRQERPAASAA